MAKYKIRVSYDGTDFCGWQRQKPHKHAPEKPSIQETLENALTKIFNHPVEVMGSGRTDAGVHAVGQIAHFETDRKMPKDLSWAVQSLLPPTVVIKKVWEAPDDFHATLSATRKTYRFWVWNHPRPSALLHRYSVWYRFPFDLSYLNEQAQFLVKEQDFKSFQSVGTPVLHSIREVYSAQWAFRKPGLLQFEIVGSGFLKQMVRNIVGTQLDLAMKRQPLGQIQQILDAKDRKAAGPAAPPQGLFLYSVEYPKELDNKCREL